MLELLSYAPTAKVVGLSEEQQRQVREITNNHLHTSSLILTHLGTAGPSDELTTRVNAALREQTEKQLAKVLTEQQRETVKDLVGAPFTGTIQLRNRIGTGGFPGGPPASPRQP